MPMVDFLVAAKAHDLDPDTIRTWYERGLLKGLSNRPDHLEVDEDDLARVVAERVTPKETK